MKSVPMIWKAGVWLLLVALFWGTQGFAATVLTAKKVSSPPKIDGKIDKVWKKAKRAKIKLKGKFTVNTKAVYTDTHIYFLFQWPDKNKSMNRVYTFKKGKWVKKRGNEDRFNVMWSIGGSIKQFQKKGCQIACHKNDDDEGSMNTNNKSELGDLWHWKSQRTNPAGYADDQLVTSTVKTSHGESTGRIADKNTAGGYSKNWDSSKKRPKYTFSKGKGGPVLLAAKAKKIGQSAKFAEGFVLPREVLAKPDGSRGDVAAKGVWKKKKWTLELGRKLANGHSDDVQFDQRSQKYYFGISVHNNAGGDTHATSKVVELRFK